MRRAIALALLVGCETEPGPGEVGYENCTAQTLPGCGKVSSCCVVVDAESAELDCRYEMADGETFPCNGMDCVSAATRMICEACNGTVYQGC